MNSSCGHIITWIKWVMYELVARNSCMYKPSISKSFFYCAAPPEDLTASVPDRSHIYLLFCVGGCGFGDLCARSSLHTPLARLNHGRCFLCGNAEAQTVFETFPFCHFICLLFYFCTVASESVTDWSRNKTWQTNTCVLTLCMVCRLLKVLCVLLLCYPSFTHFEVIII